MNTGDTPTYLNLVVRNSLRVATPSLLALAATTSTYSQDDEQVYELSPFEVDGSDDVGYAAQNTLAGSRMNSRLKDTPTPLTVYTKEFMEDIGADSLEETLEYSVNMTPEMSQDEGDFGANQGTAFDARYRIRGLNADQARNFFAYEWDQDIYNIERVDESRGPNSILFGIAKAGGLINSSTKKPILADNFTTLNVTVGDADRFRTSLDFNKVLIEDKLGVRFNLLHNENGENKRPWVSRRDDRYHMSVKYRPFEKTTIDFEYEYGDVIDSPTQPFGPQDRASVWLAAGRPLTTSHAGSAEGLIGSNSGAGHYVYIDNGTGMVANHSGLAKTSISDAGFRDNHFTFDNNLLSDPSGVGTLEVPVYASLSGPLSMRGSRDITNMTATINQQFGENTFLELAWAKYEVDRFSHRMGGGVDLQGDPNPTLADGSPNPWAGELFFETRLERDTRLFTEDYLRATLSHEIDTDGWLGKHRLAGMVQSRESGFQRNSQMHSWVNPSQANDYRGGPFTKTAWGGQNQVKIRHYLEYPTDVSDWRVGSVPGVGFGSDWNGESLSMTVPFSALRYSSDFPEVDPNTPVEIVSDWITNRVKDEESTIDAKMIAGQSFFLDNKLVVTYGLREDDFYLFSPNGNGLVDPTDGQRNIIDRENALVQEFTGETESYGAVYHLTDQISLIYNSSTNAGISDYSDKDIFGAPGEQGGINPVPSGKSEDFGISASLLEGRFFLKAAMFETSSNNTTSFLQWVDGNPISGVNNLYDELEDLGLITEATNQSQRTTAEVGTTSGGSEGYEFTAIGNLTPSWRATFNYSYTDVSITDTFHEFTPWWEGSTGKSFFQQFASEVMIDPIGDLNEGATVADGIAYIENAAQARQALAGGIKPGQRQKKANFFTNYTFREGRFNNLRIGGGARYASGRIQVHPDLGVLEHNDSLYFDTVIGWTKKFERYTLDLQLNIRNLFDEDEISINQVDTAQAADGNYYVRNYILPKRRDIKLRAAFRF
ncbi:TonB-dependent siderophore receptor [Pelagicoccus mobilis]|uniref:TonB-dependent receptor plug domain-containing protein n=1 Tax=Pelagicoccus mobilis TaxID=415221 RepID=A0A934S6C5_9BACT|nr:TonB-dependent receptor plug domain-containing protein [Pelagicoccus mobilis]MBK1879753.1 hypothetical protein [Pelagicoccus mobilis]